MTDDIKPSESAEVRNVPIEKRGFSREKPFDREAWHPKTAIGTKVKSGGITDIDTILDSGMRIMEGEIVDFLLPNMQVDLVSVGQSKGKFGGGKRSIWRQTQKKTSEGNKPKFSAVAIIGNRDGYVGIGLGKAKETVPAREKSVRQAKINLIKVRRGCGSWECGCGTPHSIPFKIKGKCGSVSIELMPAPKGTGICAEKECSKILALAGIRDIYTATHHSTRTKLNLVKACMDALIKLSQIKIKQEYVKTLGIKEGNK